MDLNEYQRLAERTSGVYAVYKGDNPAYKDVGAERLKRACFGLAGEVGEVVDNLKKHFYHGHAFDREKLIGEAGDIAWYLADLCGVLGTTLEEVCQRNVRKLEARYPNGFEVSRSVNRESEVK